MVVLGWSLYTLLRFGLNDASIRQFLIHLLSTLREKSQGLMSPDVFTPDKRSEVMSLIKGKNTKPELLIRKLIHGMGFRFRLHRRDLPGRPDLVLPKYRTAIFIHGCFWHQHRGCKEGRLPKSRLEFWTKKLTSNVGRDARNVEQLERLNWKVITLWQCEIERDLPLVMQKLKGSLKV